MSFPVNYISSVLNGLAHDPNIKLSEKMDEFSSNTA